MLIVHLSFATAIAPEWEFKLPKMTFSRILRSNHFIEIFAKRIVFFFNFRLKSSSTLRRKVWINILIHFLLFLFELRIRPLFIPAFSLSFYSDNEVFINLKQKNKIFLKLVEMTFKILVKLVLSFISFLMGKWRKTVIFWTYTFTIHCDRFSVFFAAHLHELYKMFNKSNTNMQ